ncbi:MAG: PriCT-2 domain-containing protein [Saprospiraceae bacterium]|nr:PriCT-2 domain-containing protein [Saprospiraceae bacterium]
MENRLHVEVSYFKNCTATDAPVTVSLLTFLRSERYRTAVDRVRAETDKKTRDNLKRELLPAVTPSGIFSHRAERGLLKHSGLIAGDIDFADNPYNPETIKNQVAKIRNVAYCGLSASGRGLWFLVPVKYPERHKEHFAALVADFARLGITLDTAPANVASLRFYSYDPDARYNPAAVAYSKLLSRQPDTYTPTAARTTLAGNDGEKLEAVVRQIEGRGLDITGNYDQWFSLLSALATFGEAGRDYAHRVSRFYGGYSSRETDKQFSACLRMGDANRFTLGTLFKVAADHGARYADTFAQEARAAIPLPAPTAPQPVAPGVPSGWQPLETQNQFGDRVRTWLDADGLPADWSGENAATLAALNTDTEPRPYQSQITLLERYGFTFIGQSKYNPAKDDGLLDRCLERMEAHRTRSVQNSL